MGVADGSFVGDGATDGEAVAVAVALGVDVDVGLGVRVGVKVNEGPAVDVFVGTFVGVRVGGTKGSSSTVLGDDNFFMALSHVGHNCTLGNSIVVCLVPSLSVTMLPCAVCMGSVEVRSMVVT